MSATIVSGTPAMAAATASPDLTSLALGRADLAGLTVTQEGYIAPPSGSTKPLKHLNRVFTLAPGGVLQHGESDVALYSSRDAAGATIARLSQAAHGKGVAKQVATALKVNGLTVMHVHPLGLGDQSLEVAYRYTAPGAAGPTEESLAFVRVGAIVQRIWPVGRRIDEGTVKRLAGLLQARARRAKQ